MPFNVARIMNIYIYIYIYYYEEEWWLYVYIVVRLLNSQLRMCYGKLWILAPMSASHLMWYDYIYIVRIVNCDLSCELNVMNIIFVYDEWCECENELVVMDRMLIWWLVMMQLCLVVLHMRWCVSQ